ncbi:hypothetical protein ACRRS0_16025 [Agarivorans sp. QJM3NY_29]|uniref:hypothetical protein n=1 Tax=unclassified Agarivorans TaxID=2636026 RepID=UPI003D7E05E8
MKKFNNSLSMLTCYIVLSTGIAAADTSPTTLTTFKAGETIKANEMNGNFSYLERLANSSTTPNNQAITLDIDCASNADALNDYFANPGSERFVSLTLTGTCAGDGNAELVISRDNIKITGGSIDSLIKVVGKQDVNIIGTSILGNTDSNRAAFIDAGSAVYFENNTYPAGSELLATGTSSIVYNDDVDGLKFVATLSSRLFFFSPEGKAQLILLDTASSMEYTNLSSAELTASNASGFKHLGEGSLLVDNLRIRTNAGGTVYNASMANELDLFNNGGLLIEGDLRADTVYIGSSSSLGGNTMTANNIELEGNASIDVDAIGTLNDPVAELTLRSGSSLWTKQVYADKVELQSAKVDAANFTINSALFVRNASVISNESFVLGSTASSNSDFGGFSYFELAYPIDAMCNNFNRYANVDGWSFASNKGFPNDCPNMN